MSLQSRIQSAIEEGKISFEQLGYTFFPSYIALQNPNYEFAPHNRLLCDVLSSVEAGKIRRLIISMPPRHGKNCADSTLVCTPHGWRRHGDLKVGDYVFGPDGKPAAIIYRSEKKLCDTEVVLSNGEIIKTSQDHLWTVYDRSQRQWRNVETKDIAKRIWYGTRGKRGGRRRWLLPDINCAEFVEQKLLMHPYVLGAWLGDGSEGTCRIAHGDNGCEVIKKIVDCGYLISKQWQQPNTKVFYTQFGGLQGVGSKFHNELKALEVLHNKHIPEIYLRSSREQREQLLAGLIDTDGHVEVHTGRVRFSTCSPALRDNVFDLVTTLGFRPYIIQIAPATSSSGIIGKKIVYQIGFQPIRPLPVQIPRKKIANFAVRRRIAIDNIRSAQILEFGHCIKIDRKDGLYLVGKQLIPTHNTYQVSEFFPAWYLGRNPSHQIISTSYSWDRANDVGRKVRNQLIEPMHHRIFEDCRISDDSKSANKFSTMQGGNYYSVGIGGATVGRGANLFIIDDPIKSREVAESAAAQKRLIDWYRSVAYTRLMPDNAIIIVMTRWHFYDLVGYVLEESVHDWTVISLPAICDSDSDPLGRQFGEPLWPSRYPVKILHEIQSEVGTVEWNAQYQQRPLPAEGGMVELKWFQRYNQHQINMTEIGLRLGGTPNIPFNIEKIVLSWDTAFKESQLNDPSSCTVWGVAKDMNYLIEVFNKRMKYPELKRKVIELHEHYSRWGLGPVRVLIEDRASGQSLIQDLRHETQIPVIAMPASNDKKIRLSKVTPLMEAGKVSLPEKAPWLVRYETQMAQFPYGKEDDDVDSTAHFLNWVSKPRFVRSRFPKFWK